MTDPYITEAKLKRLTLANIEAMKEEWMEFDGILANLQRHEKNLSRAGRLAIRVLEEELVRAQTAMEDLSE